MGVKPSAYPANSTGRLSACHTESLLQTLNDAERHGMGIQVNRFSSQGVKTCWAENFVPGGHACCIYNPEHACIPLTYPYLRCTLNIAIPQTHPYCTHNPDITLIWPELSHPPNLKYTSTSLSPSISMTRNLDPRPMPKPVLQTTCR